ncbi:hypothetical protein BW13_07705 [Bifidobacterium sp. UTCIF-37]|nr:hypothetical protein BW13_07705 [Bifidobacterium sp. UTCIF-37]TPF88187.1 hypothetical protein BW11_08080 [Bifidobacterium sp. UTCIF-38]
MLNDRSSSGNKLLIVCLIAIVLIVVFGPLVYVVVSYSINMATYNPIDDISSKFSITFPEKVKVLKDESETSFHGDGFRYYRIAIADNEEVADTVLDDESYSTGNLTEDDKSIIAGTIAEFDLGVQPSALYGRPHKTVFNGYDTLVIIKGSQNNEYHIFESIL